MSERRIDRFAVRTLPALVLVLAVPYAIAGPGYFADDWFHLGNARIDGWLMASGPVQWEARPGAALVYALTFGLFGDRPHAYFLVATALLALAAVLLFRIVRRFEGATVAFAVCVIWVIAPNHSSLEMWPSTINIVLALDLLLVGTVLLLERSSARSDVVALVVFAAGVLTYEAVGPAAALVVVLVAATERHADRRRAGRLLIGGGIVLGAAAVWLLTHWHPMKQGLDVWIDVGQILPGHFGTSVFGAGRVGVALLLVIVGALMVEMVGRASDKAWRSDRALRLMAAGFAVIAVGALPFVTYIYSPVGLNDRVTVVSGIGGALVMVGAATTLAAHSRVVTGSVIVVGIAAALVWRFTLVDLYATAADDGRRIVDEIEDRHPEPPDADLVFGPDVVVRENILSMLYPEHTVRWLYDERDLDAQTFRGEPGFYDVDPHLRIDLFELSELDSK